MVCLSPIVDGHMLVSTVGPCEEGGCGHWCVVLDSVSSVLLVPA